VKKFKDYNAQNYNFTEGVGGWRRLHNKELRKLYTSPNVIGVVKSRRMIWAGHVASMGDMRNAYNISVGKPGKKGPLGRPSHRCEDNIRMDLRKIGWETVDWIHLAQIRDKLRALVKPVVNLPLPQQASRATVSFSMRTLFHGKVKGKVIPGFNSKYNTVKKYEGVEV